MKIHIIFNFSEGPSGGGNQFLKALKNFFIKKDLYTDTPEKAEIILFNSHHFLNKVIEIKKKYPEKVFVHRIDGPMRLYNTLNDKRDFITNTANRYLANGTIFQSKWSMQSNKELGLHTQKKNDVILNAPDPMIFYKKNKNRDRSKKLKLIASCWSTNIRKGFLEYKWLDDNLNFTEYDMSFIGRTPIEFKNIRMIKALNSSELADHLRDSDIFITASQNEPCSNALLEAMHCGLPSIGLNQGGTPEIIQNAGLCFETIEQVPLLIKNIQENYTEFQNNNKLPDFNFTGNRYIDFFTKLLKEKKQSKSLTYLNELKILYSIIRCKFQNKFNI